MATTMVASGVLDRHPRLRLLVSEGGATWVPFIADRIEEGYRQHGLWVRPDLSRPPREIVYEQVYASFQHDKSALLPAPRWAIATSCSAATIPILKVRSATHRKRCTSSSTTSTRRLPTASPGAPFWTFFPESVSQPARKASPSNQLTARANGADVKTRFLGSLEVPVVGLGTNNFGTDFFGSQCDLDDATRIISAALDAGVTFIDTAEEYSVTSTNGTGQSEQFVGAALKRLGTRRDQLIIATKFLNVDIRSPDERGPKRIVRALEGSLKRLGVDHIDLYQQHRPDPDTPIEDILAALDRLVRDGKVREIGCSRFSGEQIDEARAASDQHALAPFVSSQSRYNLLEQPGEEGVLEACERHSMMLLPYYPLASGLLTGKYSHGSFASTGSRLTVDTPISNRMKTSLLTEDRFKTVASLELFAGERGHTLLELAISWLTSQPFVASVIAGATRPEQVLANAASASWELSEDEVREVQAVAGAG